MIGKIKGKIAEVDGDVALIETKGGVFYRVFTPLSYLQRMGEEVEIYTYLHVREDEMTLFGFETLPHYRVFIFLLGVDGVGPRLAYKILNFLTLEQLTTAVEDKAIHVFQSVPGVGGKTAQKILLELSGKMGGEVDVTRFALSEDDRLVVSALKTLGFGSGDVQKVLGKLDGKLSVEEKIRQAIVEMTKK